MEPLRLRQFEDLVEEALAGLPEEILDMLENVGVVVANFPTREQMAAHGLASRYDLFGLYEGVPQTERSGVYGMVLPDKITIFKGPLEAACADARELTEEVRKTVVHELAHHFGIGDDRLDAMGY